MELIETRHRTGRTKIPVPAWLEKGLTKLSAEERTCLLLREQAELSVREIADITGLGPERTRLALFSAREQLRAALRGA